MRLEGLWQEPELAKPATIGGGLACQFAAPPIIDLRDDPTLVGVINGRKLLLPDDRAAWLSSVLFGLRNRGIDLRLVSTAAEDSDNRTIAVLSLRSAWVDYYQGGFTSVVTFNLSLKNGKSTIEKTVQSRATTTNFLGGIRQRAESSLNKAVAEALDDLAVLMISSCA